MLDVGLEHVHVRAALLRKSLEVRGAALLTGLHGGRGALDASDDGLRGAVQLLGSGRRTVPDCLDALGGLLAGLLDVLCHLAHIALDVGSASLHLRGIYAEPQLGFSVFGGHAHRPKEKAPRLTP
ncbi:hypothetical protein [Paracidovorax cattleyae]|uniref:hypothetical protein n=1 Tax=Paracidovorax cattleyae TaxID=80868 RepID=UPI001E51F082|nr:hypothetical protein [Paracidovorax cattleyae]